MPSASHQTERRDKPKRAELAANGAPLSLRMRPGRPCRLKTSSMAAFTVSVFAFSSARNSKTCRLNSSRIVSGSQREGFLNGEPLEAILTR